MSISRREERSENRKRAFSPAFPIRSGSMPLRLRRIHGRVGVLLYAGRLPRHDQLARQCATIRSKLIEVDSIPDRPMSGVGAVPDC